MPWRVHKHCSSFLTILWLAFAGCLSIFSLPAHAQSPSTIPVETFAELENFSQPKLSPSGNRVGYLSDENGERIFVSLALDDSPTVSIPPQPNSQIQTFYWIDDDFVLLHLSIVTNKVIYGLGDLTTETRIIAYDIKSGEARWLGKPDNGVGLSSNPREYSSQFERVVDFLPDEPDHILLQLDLTHRGRSAIYKVNVRTGRRIVEKTGNDGIQNWYSDQTSTVRFGVGILPGTDKRYAILNDGTGDWTNLTRLEWYEKYSFIGFSPKPDIIYVTGPSEYGTTGLYTLSLLTGKIITAVFESETSDVTSVYFDEASKKLIGVRYGADTIQSKYFDPNYAALKNSIDQASPQTTNGVLGKSANGKYLIRTASSRLPGRYYIFDSNSNGLFPLADTRDKINPDLMSGVTSVQIPTRDGAEITALLTLPIGEKKHQDLPFVVLPHGGPHAHDTAAWDFWSQFYASRGYGVIQPNFRGSTGYGMEYENAGVHQWGGLMQDDITDATLWLVSQKLAAPDRICIVGASFGGYAALMGTIQEPSLYQCAISVNGATNLPELKAEDRRFLGGRQWTQTMGLEGTKDTEVSPYHRAEQITKPVLLIAMEDDTRIPWRMSKDMHDRLKKLGKDSKFVKIKEGTHNMVTAQSRLRVLKVTEDFLEKHIGD